MDQTTIIAAVGVPVASALIAIGVWLGKREPAPHAPVPQPSMPTIPPTLATQAELEAVRRTAEDARRAAEGAQTAASIAKQATDGMLPRLARAEADIQEHDGILRTVEVNVGRLGERLKVKVEGRDGKRESG